jgi:hypothetical protein
MDRHAYKFYVWNDILNGKIKKGVAGAVALSKEHAIELILQKYINLQKYMDDDRFKYSLSVGLSCNDFFAYYNSVRMEHNCKNITMGIHQKVTIQQLEKMLENTEFFTKDPGGLTLNFAMLRGASE